MLIIQEVLTLCVHCLLPPSILRSAKSSQLLGHIFTQRVKGGLWKAQRSKLGAQGPTLCSSLLFQPSHPCMTAPPISPWDLKYAGSFLLGVLCICCQICPGVPLKEVLVMEISSTHTRTEKNHRMNVHAPTSLL